MQLPSYPLDLATQVVLEPLFPVGFGGYSDVYRAVTKHGQVGGQMVENKLVAVKVLRLVSHCTIERATKWLHREAAAWRRLSHPNIATFYRIGTLGGRPALVLAWYENGSASTYLVGKPLAKKMNIIKDAARGLAYVHARHVVHGDVKGSNIFITDDGHAVLTDFGLSRVTDVVGPTGVTTSSPSGSLRWLAPELLINMNTGMLLKQRTTASDIWAFGCTIYELLVDKLPYHHLRDIISIIAAITRGVVPLRAEDAAIFSLRHVHDLLLTCWQLQPRQRPTMGDIVCRL